MDMFFFKFQMKSSGIADNYEVSKRSVTLYLDNVRCLLIERMCTFIIKMTSEKVIQTPLFL